MGEVERQPRHQEVNNYDAGKTNFYKTYISLNHEQLLKQRLTSIIFSSAAKSQPQSARSRRIHATIYWNVTYFELWYETKVTCNLRSYLFSHSCASALRSSVKASFDTDNNAWNAASPCILHNMKYSRRGVKERGGSREGGWNTLVERFGHENR